MPEGLYNEILLEPVDSSHKSSFVIGKDNVSPIKYYNGSSKMTPVKQRLSKENSECRSKKSNKNSFITQAASSINVKKENQIYVRSLEEFVESNIKCVNDLIEYKQNLNVKVVRLNAQANEVKAHLEFKQKERFQIKSEIASLNHIRDGIKSQTEDMYKRICLYKEKILAKKQKYAKINSKILNEFLTQK